MAEPSLVLRRLEELLQSVGHTQNEYNERQIEELSAAIDHGILTDRQILTLTNPSTSAVAINKVVNRFEEQHQIDELTKEIEKIGREEQNEQSAESVAPAEDDRTPERAAEEQNHDDNGQPGVGEKEARADAAHGGAAFVAVGKEPAVAVGNPDKRKGPDGPDDSGGPSGPNNGPSGPGGPNDPNNTHEGEQQPQQNQEQKEQKNKYVSPRTRGNAMRGLSNGPFHGASVDEEIAASAMNIFLNVGSEAFFALWHHARNRVNSNDSVATAAEDVQKMVDGADDDPDRKNPFGAQLAAMDEKIKNEYSGVSVTDSKIKGLLPPGEDIVRAGETAVFSNAGEIVDQLKSALAAEGVSFAMQYKEPGNPNSSIDMIFNTKDTETFNNALTKIQGMNDAELAQQKQQIANRERQARSPLTATEPPQQNYTRDPAQTLRDSINPRDTDMNGSIADDDLDLSNWWSNKADAERNSRWNNYYDGNSQYSFDYNKSKASTTIKDGDKMKQELSNAGFEQGIDYAVSAAAVGAGMTYAFDNVDPDKAISLDAFLDSITAPSPVKEFYGIADGAVIDDGLAAMGRDEHKFPEISR